MNKQYSEEYKLEAVRLVLEGGLTVPKAASDLGIGVSTLERWIAKYRKRTKLEALNENEREELKRLRKENRRLRQEQEILKKAAAYFAKSTLPDVSGS